MKCYSKGKMSLTVQYAVYVIHLLVCFIFIDLCQGECKITLHEPLKVTCEGESFSNATKELPSLAYIAREQVVNLTEVDFYALQNL